jgi:serine/threonine protein kinase
MVDRTLDHYRIIAPLGEGGMGVVYRARDIHLDRTVAIKLLRPDKVADANRRQRFFQEAKAASALNHPNIVTIHDIRSVDGFDLIAMEYVSGRTLAEVIPFKGLSSDTVLRYAVQIADGLARAHNAGIIHRDLKPSNLMVTDDGGIKILDFGLAKLLEPTQLSPDDSTLTALPPTEEGIVFGTAAYMSPEQANGLKVDARSDIFSFGSVVYEMLTGKRPFTGTGAVQVLNRIQNEEPVWPRQLNPAIPAELERIVVRCMRKDPARRYQTMLDLKAALEDLREEPASRQHSPARLKFRLAWAGLIPIVVIAVYLAGRAWRAREPVQPLQATALTTFPGPELFPTFSPDGNHVAFTWSGPKQENVDIYVQQIGSAGTALRLTSDAQDDHNPAWSPDGRWIAFLRGDASRPLARSRRELRLVPPLRGPEKKLADIEFQELTTNSVLLDWCPDSKCVVVTDAVGSGGPDALFIVSIETGEKRRLTSPRPPVLADTNPAVSPDGRSLLFIRRTTWAIGDLHVLPLTQHMTADGPEQPIRLSRINPDSVSWLPDSREIILSAGWSSGRADLWRVSRNGGDAVRLPFVGEDGVMPAISRAQGSKSSRLVYVRSFTDDNIWQVDTGKSRRPASAAPAIAISSTKSDIHCMFSPDGKRVAFTSTRSGAWEIWVSDRDGSSPVQLTFLRAPTGTGVPRWSPDGKLIVFASDANGQFDIFTVPSAGGKTQNVASHPAFDHVPSFSADGNWIYFSSARTGDYQIWKVRVAGGDPVKVTNTGGWASFESTDGAHLYYSQTAAVGSSQPLWRIPTTGGQPARVLASVYDDAFAVHRQGIYYAERIGDEIRIQFYDFSTRHSINIARNAGGAGAFRGLTVSPDGRTVLYAKQDAAIADLMLVENFR